MSLCRQPLTDFLLALSLDGCAHLRILLIGTAQSKRSLIVTTVAVEDQ
jgi:hypothetical protein